MAGKKKTVTVKQIGSPLRRDHRQEADFGGAWPEQNGSRSCARGHPIGSRHDCQSQPPRGRCRRELS
jgi:hypothetical protein